MQPRAVALGQHLLEVHGWLREQLDAIRTDAAAFAEGGGIRATDLRTHCLTFCSILERHHTGEDQQLFPFLAGQHPELGPVIEELMRDHGQVAEILVQITELVRDLVDGVLGERDAGVLGLHPVDGVAEGPAAVEALAVLPGGAEPHRGAWVADG